MQNVKTHNRNFESMHSISSNNFRHRCPQLSSILVQVVSSFHKIFIHINVAGCVLTALSSAYRMRYSSLSGPDHRQGRAGGPAPLANAFACEQQAVIPVAHAAIAANNHVMPRMLKQHLKTYGTSINSSRTASLQCGGAAV